ncbi:MAG: hypothetical protein Q4D38_07290 [Planctomycetia bacterium]|nr:hypothetical protein [Planctomycetia bacterium]
MSDAPKQPMFSQIDVTNIISSRAPQSQSDAEEQTERRHGEIMGALHELMRLQAQQNDLMMQLLNLQTNVMRQRANEQRAWRKAHPELSKGCRELVQKLGEVQVEYFGRMVDEASENNDDWGYSEFMVNDFLDKFGPRVQHLNALLGLLSQIAATDDD